MHTLFLLLALSASAFAGEVAVPEIDATSAAGALTVLSGAVLLLRSRRAQK